MKKLGEARLQCRARADHGHRVIVYGADAMPPYARAGIFVKLGNGKSATSWLTRARLRQVRDALDRVLGDAPRRRKK